MKPKSTLRSYLALAGSSLLAISYSHAATLYWDTNGSSGGFGSLDGTWASPTSARWSTNSLGTSNPPNNIGITSLDDINFGTAANAYSGIVSLSANQSARSVTFAGSSTVTLKGNGTARMLTLGSGGLTMNDTSTVTLGDGVAGNNLLIGLGAMGQIWTNNTANNLTINNTAATFTRSAGGTITFNKVSTGEFSMSTTVLPNEASGIIGPWAFFGTGTSTRYAFNNSGTIAGYSSGTAATDAEAFTDSTTNYDFSTTGTTTLTASRTANTTRYDGTGNVIDLGASGANTLTTNGILAAGASGTLTIQRTGGTGTLVAGSTGTDSELVIAGPQAISISAPISNGVGNSAVTYIGTGTLTLSGDNTYSGGTTVNSSTLVVGSATALGASGKSLNVHGTGTLDFNGFDYTVGAFNGDNGNATVTNSGPSVKLLTVGSGNTSGTFAGAITGALGLIKTGSGPLTLSGSNTYTGSTAINVGTVIVSHANALGTTAGNTTIAATGSTSTGGQLQLTGGITLAENITITGSTENSGFAGAILGSANNTVTLSGNIILSNLTGGVRIATSNAGAKMNFTGTISQTGSSEALVFALGNAGGQTVTIDNAIALNGGGLIVTGNGSSLIFKGVNATDGSGIGTTTINSTGAGIQLGVTNAINTTATLSVDGGNFNLAGFDQTVNALTSSSTAGTVRNTVAGTRTLTVGNGGGSGTFGGTIVDGSATAKVALIKAGNGTQTLTGANTYTGGTQITGGRLSIGTTGTINGTSGVSIGEGEFNYNNSTTALTQGITFSGSTGTLSGTGTITPAVVITSGNRQTAGTSVTSVNTTAALGKQTFSTGITYDSGSIFEWNLNSTTVGTRGTDFDAVNTAALAGTGAIFRVILNGTENFGESFWDTDQTWAGIFKSLDETSAYSLTTVFNGGFEYQNSAGTVLGVTGAQGTFTFINSGQDLKWTAAVVPEPTSALAGLLLGAGLLRRRRTA